MPRRLGVVEAFTAVVNQCPSGAVQSVARNALEALQREGSRTLPEQAFRVLSAVRGWRGPVAARVKEALEAFLAEAEERGG